MLQAIWGPYYLHIMFKLKNAFLQIIKKIIFTVLYNRFLAIKLQR